MKLKIRGLSYLLLSSLVISNPLFAAIPLLAQLQAHGYFEAIGAPGNTSFNENSNTELGVTRSETDELRSSNNNKWNNLSGQIGAGYVYNFSDVMQYQQVSFFPSIEPELNVYPISSSNFEGDVWRFNSSAFNDLTYTMPVQSTRLMVDVALTVAAWRQFSIYALGGIGSAWNKVSYSDTDNSVTPCDQRLSLNANTVANFAWEAGVGLLYTFNNRIGVSLEYLYADLGSVSFSSSGNTGTITTPVISTSNFNLRSQTGLLGLHIAL